MKLMMVTKWLRGAALLAVAALALAGCSDSDTDSKDVGPYANSDLLVSGASLAANLTKPGQVIVDVRPAADYAAAHVPGAINIPIVFGVSILDKGGDGTDNTDLKPVPELVTALGAAGIKETDHVIIYGAAINPQAGRLFWTLEYLGATKVSMLDGGFTNWTANSRATSTEAKVLPATTFTPHVVSARLVDKSDILAHYNDTDHYTVIDSRNKPDYDLAHIPRAVNILVDKWKNDDKATMKTSLEIEALFADNGVSKDKTIYTHCYIGYRSSEAYFMFRLMGYNVSHYDGSWTDWAADETTPKEGS